MKNTAALLALSILTGCASLAGQGIDSAKRTLHEAQEVVEVSQDALLKEAEGRVCLRMTMQQYRARFPDPNSQEAQMYWAYCSSVMRQNNTGSEAPIPGVVLPTVGVADPQNLTPQAAEMLRNINGGQ